MLLYTISKVNSRFSVEMVSFIPQGFDTICAHKKKIVSKPHVLYYILKIISLKLSPVGTQLRGLLLFMCPVGHKFSIGTYVFVS